MASVDYYAVLGVSRDASQEEIKRAFRRKARETHPDVADDPGAEERFKLINEAYEVLSDEQKRANYDRYGTPDPRVGGFGADFPGFGDVVTFGDIFETFFSGVAAGMGGGAVRVEGRDMSVQVTVTLEDAAAGVEREIPVTRLGPCAACRATGAGPGGSVKACPVCGGTGQRRSVRRTILGVMQSLTPCDRCEATGRVVDSPCPECGGTGRVQVTEQVTVSVPAGVADGQTVRVPGMGEAGVRGARSGDLLVRVRVAEHEYLHREGDDLHVMVVLNIAQAALGATVTVPGLGGEETVEIPVGTQTGDVLRLRGRGMPGLRGGRGDMLVHVRVEVPRKLDKRQRELLRELGETLGTGRGSRTPLERIKDWLGA